MWSPIYRIITWVRGYSFRRTLRSERSRTYLWSSSSSSAFTASRKAPLQSRLRPLFTHSWQDSSLPLKHLSYLVGGVLILLVMYILVFSPYFRLSASAVAAERADPLVDMTLVSRALEPWYGKNLIALDTTEIVRSLVTAQRSIARVNISRSWPNGLVLLIASHESAYRTALYGKPYILTENGVAIYSSSTDSTIPVIDIYDTSLSENALIDYQVLIPRSTMASIRALTNEYQSALWPQSPIIRTQYFADEWEVHFILESGTRLMFDLSERREEAVSALKYLINRGMKSGEWLTMNYIDLRAPQGRLFFCREETICDANITRIYGKRVFDR